jgi:hypothetical protein
MSMVSMSSIDIRGRERSVPNTLFETEGATHVAIVFPGLAYTCGMPLLWYPTHQLLSMGADVLWVEYDYHRLPGFRSLDDGEQERLIRDEAAAAVDAVLGPRGYERVTLIGKSIGTVAMDLILETDDRLQSAETIWLTPVVSHIEPRRAAGRGRALFVIGTADPSYDPDDFDAFVRAAGGSSLVVEEADHALQVGTDPLRAIEIVREVVVAIRTFLKPT